MVFFVEHFMTGVLRGGKNLTGSEVLAWDTNG